MKVIGSTQSLSPETTALDISSHLATALGARNGATLYAIGFRRHVPTLGDPGTRTSEGESKPAVEAWQAFLARYELDGGEPAYTGKVDGVWGPLTTAATKLFQSAETILDDGRVGRQTLSAAYRAGYRATSTAPVATIIASPFPTSSWRKLLRMSVIREPKPGGAHGLLRALTKLGLACRFIEVIQPMALGEMELFSRHHLPRYTKPDPRNPQSAIMTPLDVVVELPAQHAEFSDEFGLTFEDAPNQHEMFKQLSDLITNAAEAGGIDDPGAQSEPMHDNVRMLVNKALREALPGSGVIRVASLKPMHTLNALALRYKDLIKSAREKRRIGRRPRGAAGSVLTFDITPWQALLWHQAEGVPVDRDTGDSMGNQLIAVSYADSEEKFICWNFYDLRQRIIVEFDVEVPSDVADFLWREWVYGVISTSGGDVIASYTSPRLRDGGLVCSLIVVFPFVESARPDHTGDVAKIIRCFDELLGSAGSGAKYAELRKQLPKSYHHAAEHALGAGNVQNLREGTAYHTNVTLSPVRMWSPEVAGQEKIALGDGQSIRYRERFKSNPFFFTHSMSLEEYNSLYSSEAARAAAKGRGSLQPTTRLDVAGQIVRDLASHRENIAVVGAHRCGKSTVLNLVHTLLLERLNAIVQRPEPGQSQPPSASAPVIPLRINAALTPIREFPQAIIEAIERLEGDMAKAQQPDAERGTDPDAVVVFERRRAGAKRLQKVFRTIGASFSNVFQSDVTLEIDAQLVKLKLGGKEKLGAEQKVTLEQYRKLKAIESPAYDLRRGLEFLQQVLRESRDELTAAFGGFEPCFLVIIDEVRDGLVWGEDQSATAAWRSTIEAPEFRSIRWLVASTRPIRQELSYSPVSNVFREKNMGCLSVDEAQQFLNAFGSPKQGKLAPVLTPLGRKALLGWTGRLPFLMQVACSYVFERATERDVPFITIDLCRRTLRETVAMEMSDYFAQQWEELGSGAVQTEILQALQTGYADASDTLTLKRNIRFDGLSPMTRRALSRSGLEGADGGLAPLAAYWLLSAATKPVGPD